MTVPSLNPAIYSLARRLGIVLEEICRKHDEKKLSQPSRRETLQNWPIPEEGFISDYLKWAIPRTEATVGFHLAAALVAVGLVLGRKCGVQVGDLRFYPNIYALTTGESTLERKSHAINMQRRILDRVKAFLGSEDGFYLADDGTPEGLLRELSENQSGIKAFNEFGDFLKRTKKRDFLGGFAGLFTELYDCPALYRKCLSKKGFQIEKPFLCLLGATTREWLLEGMDESDIQGGFLARFLFFPGSRDVKLIPITPPRDQEEEKALAAQLLQLHTLSGTWQPTRAAKEIYIDWYEKHRNELTQEGMSLLSPYYGRLEGYAWKIALIFEATAGPEFVESISADSTNLAIEFVERLKKDLKPLILQDFQPSAWAKKVNKIRALIERTGVIGRSALLKNSHLRSKELNDVVRFLKETGELVEEEVNKSTVYKWKKKK